MIIIENNSYFVGYQMDWLHVMQYETEGGNS